MVSHKYSSEYIIFYINENVKSISQRKNQSEMFTIFPLFFPFIML